MVVLSVERWEGTGESRLRGEGRGEDGSLWSSEFLRRVSTLFTQGSAESGTTSDHSFLFVTSASRFDTALEVRPTN